MKLITLFITIIITITIISSSSSTSRIRPFSLLYLEGKESISL